MKKLQKSSRKLKNIAYLVLLILAIVLISYCFFVGNNAKGVSLAYDELIGNKYVSIDNTITIQFLGDITYLKTLNGSELLKPVVEGDILTLTSISTDNEYYVLLKSEQQIYLHQFNSYLYLIGGVIMINRPLYFVRRNSTLVITAYITLFCFSFALLNPLSWQRMFESLKDLGLSVGYYYAELFNTNHSIYPTVADVPDSLSGILEGLFPKTAEGYKQEFFIYWTSFGNLETLKAFGAETIHSFYIFAIVLSCLLPFIAFFIVLVKKNSTSFNNRYNIDTRPLGVWKKIRNVVYYPVREEVQSYLCWLRQNPIFLRLWLTVWLINFNLITIAIETVHIYFTC